MRVFVLVFTLVLAAAAQSGRVDPATATPEDPRTVKQLFEEANSYLRTKAADFEAKKVPFSDDLFDRTKREQRQLAAKNAAIAMTRKDLAGEDLYFLGMLHWIAENLDGAAEALGKFVESGTPPVERTQSARSIITVIAAKHKKLAAAESALAEYLNTEQRRPSEIFRMEVEIAKAYHSAADLVRMAPHAESAFAAAKSSLAGAPRSRSVDEVLDSGMLVFEASSGNGDRARAEAVLDELRKTAGEADSAVLYDYIVDKKVGFLIGTGRKHEAIEIYFNALVDTQRDLRTPAARSEAFARLKQREVQYKLLGETAPEFPEFDAWLPGKPRSFASLKGKVVLIDFWAMWCGPCIVAFPSIRQWQADFGNDGLEILGVTRYYGMEVGAKTTRDEIAMLTAFRQKHQLPYDLVVANGQILQNLYGATSLPTTVIIDRRGIIRYIQSGTGPTRFDEIRETIARLVAER
jgi:thiol-disulfide isomerase/thioredoxin